MSAPVKQRRVVTVERLPSLGADQVAVRLARPPVSARLSARTLSVCVVIFGLVVLAAAVNVSVGDFPIPLSDVFPAMVGQGNPDSDFIVRVLRLPRSLTGMLVGAAFGMSGAIFQSLARNPLASPGIIGIEAGAAFAAVLVIVALDPNTIGVTAGALIGALATAVAIYLLAYRRGVTGYRLVLVGIGVTAVLGSGTSYLLTRANIYDAARATVWLTGSLNGRGWEHVGPVGAAMLVLVPATLLLGRHLRGLQLGDDAARGLGVRIEMSRAGLILAGVGLAATAVASAGPVAFVDLISPQIARRLTGSASGALLPAAVTGALITLASDLVGRQAFGTVELPVGVITAIVGAPYFLYLLAHANKVGRGG
ncbi:MAG: FecCD family ABC transporter permease [Egibacteraceae bacterium]